MSDATAAKPKESAGLRLASWAGVAALLLLAVFGATSIEAGSNASTARTGALACLALTSLAIASFTWAAGRDPAPAPSGGVAPRATRNEWLAFVAIAALATVLRAIHLNSPLWYDEVVTLVEFVRLPVPDLLTKYTTTNNHLLYSLAANRSVALFGETAAAVRLPAALFGLASIWALWRVARQMASAREALVACLLLALSYHHVWFSQNARGYTGILFFTLLGTSLFIQGMRERSRTLWLAYALVVAFGLYTHLSIVFAFASHGLIYVALAARARLRGPDSRHPGAGEWWPLAGFALGALFTLQLYAILLPQVIETFAAQQSGSGGQRVGEWTNPLWMIVELVQSLGLGPASFVAAAIAAVFGATGFGSLTRRDWTIGALIALPVILTLGALLALSFHLWPRYFLSSIGFVLLVGVRGCREGGDLLERRLRAHAGPNLGLALMGVVVLASIALLPANYRHPKQDYPAARDFVEAQREASDGVVVVSLAIYPYQNYYAPNWLPAESLEDFEEVVAATGGRWVVSSFPTYLRSIRPMLFERIERDYEAVRVFPGTLGDGDVVVYRIRVRPE